MIGAKYFWFSYEQLNMLEIILFSRIICIVQKCIIEKG